MERIINPVRERWVDLLKRPRMENADLQKICKAIFAEVLKDGDKALVKYTWFFDQAKVERLQVAEAEFREAEREVSNDLKRAITEARQNIEAFHTLQLTGRNEYVNPKGFRCWQETRGIGKVGLYIPGGSAPLFSTVLMLAGLPVVRKSFCVHLRIVQVEFIRLFYGQPANAEWIKSLKSGEYRLSGR